jgi:hypothetical protein
VSKQKFQINFWQSLHRKNSREIIDISLCAFMARNEARAAIAAVEGGSAFIGRRSFGSVAARLSIKW